MIAPTLMSPPAAASGGAPATAAPSDAGQFAALLAGASPPANAAAAPIPVAVATGQDLAVRGTLLPTAPKTATGPRPRSAVPMTAITAVLEDAATPAAPATPSTPGQIDAPVTGHADKDADADTPPAAATIATPIAPIAVAALLPQPVAAAPPSPAEPAPAGQATPPAAAAPPTATPVALPAVGADATVEPSLPTPQGQPSIDIATATRPPPSPSPGPATVAATPAAAAALPAAAAIAPVVGAAAPARQLFAAAIEAADRQDRAARQPADTGPQPAALLDTAAPRIAAAGAADGGQQTLDMRHDTWPSAMIDHIERLRDAADGADTHIRLVPDALGGIDVAISRQADGVHVALHADQAATRAMLADAQPQLADLAGARGVKLAGTAVDLGAGGNASAFDRQHQPAPRAPAPAPAAIAPTAATPSDPADGRIA